MEFTTNCKNISQHETVEGDWELVYPQMASKNKEPAPSRTASFFADAVANPGHELGPHIKTGAQLDKIYNHSCSILMMEPAPEDQFPGKTCFVTVGATVGFRSLVTEMVTPKVVSALAKQGFDTLIVQCGPDFEYFESIRPSDPEVIMEGHSVVSNVVEYMRGCAPCDGPPKRGMGLIITHAGKLLATKTSLPSIVLKLIVS